MQFDLFSSPSKFTPLVLRPYQQAAIEAAYAHLRARDDNPCIVLPTGGGKTPVIATLCRDAVKLWQGRVLVLTHVKELIQQTCDELQSLAPELRSAIGVYSAGLNRRDRKRAITVAGIQSIYKLACEFDPFNLVIVDEAHLIPPDGDGMYLQFLRDAQAVNPQIRVIGLTATPFRMKSGPICTPDGILNAICHETGVRELIVDGFLCPLISKASATRFDTSGLHLRGGEFVADEAEQLFDVPELVEQACREVVDYTRDRQSVLIFAQSKQHGQHVVDCLTALTGQPIAFVTGETPAAERDAAVEQFKEGLLKYLVNINVFTTGFNARNVDCVVLLRATNSPGLYYQMVGRGFRLFPGKQNCLVLDFGGNVLRHGPVDRIEVHDSSPKKQSAATSPPAKECPECLSVIAAGFMVCPDCGHVFPEREKAAHDAEASKAGVLSGEVTVEVLPVDRTYYSVHTKRNAAADAPRTMRVDYVIAGDFGLTHSEWICVEHDGFARRKAEAWWKARSPDRIPSTAERAVEIAEGGGLAEPSAITIRTVAGERFSRVVDWQLGPKPEPLDYEDRGALAIAAFDDDEIPF